MAEQGKLTADAVAKAVLASGDEIDSQFIQMPMTFGQGVTIIQNKISALVDKLSQPGQAFNNIIIKVQELISWLNTMEGQQFMTGLSDGINTVVGTLINLIGILYKVYSYFSENWSLIGPILLGIVSAFVTLAIIIKVVTVAQTILNAVMRADPFIAIITIIVALVVAFITLWQTNIDFRVGIIRIWNSILAFFDIVLLSFMKIGYGIMDIFSNAKQGTLEILQGLVNGAIDIVNSMIETLNKIPGVSIDMIGKVTFGTEAALAEEAKRQSRAADLSAAHDMVLQRISDRETKLMSDEKKWRQDIADKKSNAEKLSAVGSSKASDVYVTGGGLDKPIDLSNQSLKYLSDIAEAQALKQFDALHSFMYIVNDDTESKLSESDKDLIVSNAGTKTTVYYLQYQGGVNMKTEVKQGDDWETIKQKAKAETQTEIEIGLSDLDRVVIG